MEHQEEAAPGEVVPAVAGRDHGRRRSTGLGRLTPLACCAAISWTGHHREGGEREREREAEADAAWRRVREELRYF
jgi:hypothetical protein